MEIIRKILAAPTINEVFDPEQLAEFERLGMTKFTPTLPQLLRKGYTVGGARDNPDKSYEFTIPEYGVLKMQYRDYEFTPTEQYGRVLAVKNNRPLNGKW